MKSNVPLSQAIMLGSALNRLWSANDHSGNCALMAAKEAVSGDRFGAWLPHFPWISNKGHLPCDCIGANLMGAGLMKMFSREYLEFNWSSSIIHMFNHHVATVGDWTLERLCDWIRSVEPVEAQVVELAAVEYISVPDATGVSL